MYNMIYIMLYRMIRLTTCSSPINIFIYVITIYWIEMEQYVKLRIFKKYLIVSSHHFSSCVIKLTVNVNREATRKVKIISPYVDKSTTYLKYHMLKSTPPGIVKHTYLSGEFMRTMEDLLSESVEYRNGNDGNDESLDMEFYNSRTNLLNSLGYLNYQSPLLTEILSSRVDKLPELIQTNTFDQVNSHLKGFLENNDKHLTSLYMAAYYA